MKPWMLVVIVAAVLVAAVVARVLADATDPLKGALS